MIKHQYQFRTLGGLDALARFESRDEVFEALRQSTLIRQSLLASGSDAGQTLSDAQLLAMNWLVQGVQGNLARR